MNFSTRSYFIIAGCFSDEENANRLVKKLKSDGYTNSEKFASIKNMYYVCYSGHSNKDSATIELKKLQAKGKHEAWIMHYLPLLGK